MAYTKTIWINGEVALSDTNMNHIENGIKDAHDALAETDDTVAGLKTAGSELLLAIYPVGSILLNANGVNPATYIGGTWEAWGSGRVPVGVNTSDTDFSTAEKTGGEKTHQLTISEMPEHSHTVHYIAGADTNLPRGTSSNFNNGNLAVKTTYAEEVGGDQPHNNLQPYITCYMWKRTA